MDKRSVIHTLREHEPELRADGIVHLRLFGSVTRDESSAKSDVDLIADFDRSKRLSLISLVHLKIASPICRRAGRSLSERFDERGYLQQSNPRIHSRLLTHQLDYPFRTKTKGKPNHPELRLLRRQVGSPNRNLLSRKGKARVSIQRQGQMV